MSAVRTLIKKRALKLGFTDPYVANLDAWNPRTGQNLKQALDAEYHGTMAWMEETYERRSNPKNLWPEARSAVVLGMNYGPDRDPLAVLKTPQKAAISVYAQGDDYHAVMKGRLKELAGLIARDTGQDVKVFVDTAPLMEKPLAALAGLGWQGKHTNLVSREYGSWLFIGTILTAAALVPNTAEIDHCGTCRACLDVCPTDAFPAPYRLDARRCISYLTIEHSGPVDPALRRSLGNRIYGCDDCLAVCPWNKFAERANEVRLHADAANIAPDLGALSQLTDKAFRARFSRSPIKRIGLARFTRNVLYAIGNSGDKKLRPYAKNHQNSDDPVIKDAAKWAIRQIDDTP